MDRQHDLRVLLIQIQDRLSNEDRHRLHFLVGDLIPRTQRDNITRTGTLVLLESLFDRAIISEDHLDFLIQTFTELKCYDAVRRLKEFQSPQSTNLTSKISNEYTEIDKYRTIDNDRSRFCDGSSGSFSKIDVSSIMISELASTSIEPVNEQATTKTELLSQSFEIHENMIHLKADLELRKSIETCWKSACLWFLCFLFLSEIVGGAIFLWFSISHRRSMPIIMNTNIEKVYMPEQGNFPDGIQGSWFDHSQELSLTYADRLIHIDVYTHHKTLFAINFTYSNKKMKEHKLRDFSQLPALKISSIDFQKRPLDNISQCYTNQTGTKRLIGLDFSLDDDTHQYFGLCPGEIRLNDSFSKSSFGYALGKTTDYLQGIQFIWFKTCSFHSPLISCVNKNEYNLPSKDFYTDQ